MERRYLRRLARTIRDDPNSRWERDTRWVFPALRCKFDTGTIAIKRDPWPAKLELLTPEGNGRKASCYIWNPWAWEARLLRRMTREWRREDRRRQREVWEKRLAEASGVKLLASPDREGLMAEVEQEIEEALEARRITGG